MGEAKTRKQRILRGAVQLAGWAVRYDPDDQQGWQLLRWGEVLFAPFPAEERAWRYAEYLMTKGGEINVQ